MLHNTRDYIVSQVHRGLLLATRLTVHSFLDLQHRIGCLARFSCVGCHFARLTPKLLVDLIHKRTPDSLLEVSRLEVGPNRGRDAVLESGEVDAGIVIGFEDAVRKGEVDADDGGLR